MTITSPVYAGACPPDTIAPVTQPALGFGGFTGAEWSPDGSAELDGDEVPQNTGVSVVEGRP